MENLDEIKGFILYKEDNIKSSAELTEGDQQLLNPFESEIVQKFKGKAV
jgi:hypothetical protein